MADNNTPAASLGGISEEARKRVEELIEEEEGAHNRYQGVLAVLLTAAAVVMSLFHLYSAVEIVPAYILRPVHVAFALALAGQIVEIGSVFHGQHRGNGGECRGMAEFEAVMITPFPAGPTPAFRKNHGLQSVFLYRRHTQAAGD